MKPSYTHNYVATKASIAKTSTVSDLYRVQKSMIRQHNKGEVKGPQFNILNILWDQRFNELTSYWGE